MQQDTGKFISTEGMSKAESEKVAVEARAALVRLNPQYEPGKSQDPGLSVGEVVEIKMVKFRVTRIKADGKLGLKMLNESELAGLSL